MGKRSGALAVRHWYWLSAAAGLAVILLAAPPVRAADNAAPSAGPGSQSRLPIPRFVSLKSDKVNVRKGPSTDQAIVWVFARAGLPVEIIAESDNWRRVRDSEGADGWVFHSLLSGRRTALVSPWSKGKESVTMHVSSSKSSRAVAQLQSGVIGNVVECDGEWCELTVDGYDGYVEQDKLWGVYRGEKVQ